uniref:Integrase zinc-binding domain-containing protein n=1 Tax=Megaselia scalaris TaxID=36166 RepID=T1H2I4_MEGSC
MKECSRYVEKFPEKNPDFTIINGKLLKHAPNRNLTDDDWLLFVPAPMRERLLKENNDTSGHLGNRRTNLRICNKYSWPGMTRDNKHTD